MYGIRDNIINDYFLAAFIPLYRYFPKFSPAFLNPSPHKLAIVPKTPPEDLTLILTNDVPPLVLTNSKSLMLLPFLSQVRGIIFNVTSVSLSPFNRKKFNFSILLLQYGITFSMTCGFSSFSNSSLALYSGLSVCRYSSQSATDRLFIFTCDQSTTTFTLLTSLIDAIFPDTIFCALTIWHRRIIDKNKNIFYRYGYLRDIQSYPTRRSSDLGI